METLCVGYAKSEITPPFGTYLQGNPKTRIAQEVADPLHVRCVVFERQELLVMLYFDLVGMRQNLTEEIREYVASQLDCDKKNIFVSATHTHTGPNMHSGAFPINKDYQDRLKYIAAQTAVSAKNDLKDAQMHFARDKLPGLTFVRRYLMKDGSCRTNPGRHNPDIVRPMSEADEDIQLLKITREGGGDIALVNFQCHPDVVKNSMVVDAFSADYPGMVCKTLEGAIPGLNCVFCNGAAGDLNHVDVNCPEWDSNQGMEHGLHMGRTIAGKILSMYTKARPIEAGDVVAVEQVVEIPQKRPTPEQLEEAKRITKAYYVDHELDKIPAKQGTMEFITTIYEAAMLVRVANESSTTPMRVTAFRIGDFSVVGLPGEPFCQIGMDIKAATPFKAQFIFELTNGCQGYFPSKEAFAVNGYESRTSSFQPSVAEILTDTAISLLNEIKEK